jgi:DNA-binding NarL/FixJ family response regulator
MKKPRVLLADDHRIVLEGLHSLLEPEFDIVGMVEDGQALVTEALRLRPDLVVVDISMPMLNGIDAAIQLKKSDARIQVVFLTMHADVEYAASAFEAGASGFVLKHSAPSELITTLRAAMRGGSYATSAISGELNYSDRQKVNQPEESKVELSTRQREILRLLARGKSAKEIASVLQISKRTVEFHKYRMMETLNIKTSAELIQYAVKCELAAM